MMRISAKKSFRFSVLFLLLSVLVVHGPRSAAALAPFREGSAVIKKQRVVIVRKGQFVRDFPGRRRAVINYPLVVGGLSNAAALRKIRSLLQVKNIFDTSIAEYREDTWLSEFDYKVNYNENYILDITFTQDGVGAYPDTNTKHFAINLKTGDVIKAKDVFKPSALKSLAGMVDRKLQGEIKGILKDISQRSDLTADEKKNLQGDLEQLSFQVVNLDEFSISGIGITFLYDAGFPHVIQALEPEGAYFFSYAELRPFIKAESPLGVLLR